jgi:hypothetical protein
VGQVEAGSKDCVFLFPHVFKTYVSLQEGIKPGDF